MKKLSRLKKNFSALLCLCLAAGLIPTAFAELCPHHVTHGDCGYVKAVSASPCSHICDDACAEGCIHSHDGSCGYAEGFEGSPCTFVCQDCLNPPAVEPPNTEVLPDQPDEGDNGEDTEPVPGDIPSAGPKQPVVEGVLITREQYNISQLSIDESGSLIFGAASIAPQAVDPETGAAVSGKFSWGSGSAPLVILNEVGSESYPLYFIPDDSTSYSIVSLNLTVVTEEYVSKSTALISRIPLGAIASMRAASPSKCSVAVISDSDTLYMDSTLSKFKASLKPLSGQELERVLRDNSLSGKIIIDATYSGLRVDRIQLYSFTLRSFMDAIRKGESGLESIVIKLSGGEMELDLKALESLCINDDCSSVELVINRDAGPGSFNDVQKEVLRQHNVRLISRVYFDCNRREEPQSDYGDGRVTIGIPFYYGDIKLCTVAEDGTLSELEKSFENGILSWTVSEGCDFVLIK